MVVPVLPVRLETGYSLTHAANFLSPPRQGPYHKACSKSSLRTLGPPSSCQWGPDPAGVVGHALGDGVVRLRPRNKDENRGFSVKIYGKRFSVTVDKVNRHPLPETNGDLAVSHENDRMLQPLVDLFQIVFYSMSNTILNVS